MHKEQVISETELSMEDFQVVRREFFSHTREPSLNFSRYRVYANAACFDRLEDAECVQVLINPKTYILALRPCSSSSRDALSWCGIYDGRRKPRKTTCRLFFLKIAAMMGWNQNFRYKLLGRLVQAKGEALLVFDLTAAAAYPLEGKPPVFPIGWREQFGLSVEEHAQALEVPVFDGYSVYAIGEGYATGKVDHGSMEIRES